MQNFMDPCLPGRVHLGMIFMTKGKVLACCGGMSVVFGVLRRAPNGALNRGHCYRH